MSVRCAPLLALALAGCEGEAPRPAEQPRPQPATSSLAVSTPAGEATPIGLATAPVGEYRVAGVGGNDIDLPHGITATISDTGIHIVSDCVNLSWSWQFEGTRLVTERAPVEGCARGLLPEEEAIVAAFDGANRVARTPSNGIEFTGGAGSVLLFSQ